jgi:hypothetical protein
MIEGLFFFVFLLRKYAFLFILVFLFKKVETRNH